MKTRDSLYPVRAASMSGTQEMVRSPEHPSANLSHGDLLSVVTFAESALAVEGAPQLDKLLNRVRDFLPIDRIGACIKSEQETGTLGPTVRIHGNLPEDWLTHYGPMIEPVFDQVLGHPERAGTFLSWDSMAQLVQRARRMEFMEGARAYGLAEGVSAIQRTRQDRTATLLSFGGLGLCREPRHLAIVISIAPHLRSALLRAHGDNSQSTSPLSARETEVMEWVAMGKTNWEISRILGISERTVKFHVHNVMTKLEASSRAHALTVAFEGGILPRRGLIGATIA